MCVCRGSVRVKVTPGYKEEQCAPALSVEMKKPVDLEAPITRYTNTLHTNPLNTQLYVLNMDVLFTNECITFLCLNMQKKSYLIAQAACPYY